MNIELEVYECATCGYWHMTSVKEYSGAKIYQNASNLYCSCYNKNSVSGKKTSVPIKHIKTSSLLIFLLRDFYEQITNAVDENQVTIVTAETGAVRVRRFLSTLQSMATVELLSPSRVSWLRVIFVSGFVKSGQSATRKILVKLLDTVRLANVMIAARRKSFIVQTASSLSVSLRVLEHLILRYSC